LTPPPGEEWTVILHTTTRPIAATLATIAAAAFAGMFVAWPLLAVVLGPGVQGQAMSDRHWLNPGLAARTLGVGLLIGVLATVASLPGAWLIRKWGWAWAALVAVPMLTPAYLASSGFNILRAPGTWMGDWLGEWSRGGSQWPTLVVGRLLAIVGLSLWASPLPAFIIAAGLRTISDDTIDALTLEMGRVRRFWSVLSVCRGSILAGVLVVTVVMMGSAVPLHLAQMKTVSLLAWLTLLETGSVRAAAASCAPIVLLAAGVGAWAAPKLCTTTNSIPGAEPSEPARVSVSWYGLVIGGSVIVPGVMLPLALFASQIRSWEAMQRFWIESGPSIASSLIIAGVVATGCGGLAIATWRTPSRRVLMGIVAVFVAAALVPGVLVGCAWRMAWQPSWPDSWIMVALAHVTRFGIVGVLGGLWLKTIEDKATLDLMHTDGVSTVRGWWQASGVRLVGPWAAAALVAGVLSLHEIEAAVVVQPAGTLGLPQRLLNDLHQLRMEAMAAAAVWMLLIGLCLATLGLLVSRGMPSRSKPTE